MATATVQHPHLRSVSEEEVLPRGKPVLVLGVSWQEVSPPPRRSQGWWCLTNSQLCHCAAQLVSDGKKVHDFGLLLLLANLILHLVLEPLVALEAKENEHHPERPRWPSPAILSP